MIYLQNLKAPWVDECYTYFGSAHDSFSAFSYSMATGVNFSPPLYFLLNFFSQLIYPTSIELLRLQSIVWTIVGVILTFSLCRKVFGPTVATISMLLVLSQSHLLFQQSNEARHYTMFFACGAWVLFELQRFNDQGNNSKNQILCFASHTSFCLVHYLGIIFSGLVALALLIFNLKKPVMKRIPYSIYVSWGVSLPCYLVMLSDQSSHLNTWSKQNDLNHLLSAYNNSLPILSLVVPIIMLVCSAKRETTQASSSTKTHSILIAVSLLWFSSPLLFWVLSVCTDFNLFKDRYFIPKEAALIVIIAFFMNFLINKMKNTFKVFKNSLLPIGGTLILVLAIFSLSVKRSLFAIKPERNFYHWLLVNDKIPKSNLPLVFVGDPLYFPNAYQMPENSFFLLNDSKLAEIYKKFSNKIHVINNERLTDFDSFILICHSDFNRNEIDANFIQQDLVTLHERLAIHIIHFDKMNEKTVEKFN